MKLFERSPQKLDSRGGGLVLQPGVLEALDFAGVPHGDDFGVPSRDRIFIDSDGTFRRVYMPQTQIAWNGLYQRMRRHIDALMLHAGETFAGFEQDGNRVTAHFASGRTEQGDLLIGADGPV